MHNEPIYAETNLFDTVALTRVGPRSSCHFTTNAGAITVKRNLTDVPERWTVGPTGEERPFTVVNSLADAIDFVLGAREMMRPA